MRLMKKIPFLLLFMASFHLHAQTTPEARMNTFVTALMKRMTLDEKIGNSICLLLVLM